MEGGGGKCKQLFSQHLDRTINLLLLQEKSNFHPSNICFRASPFLLASQISKKEPNLKKNPQLDFILYSWM